jgi:CheY-like chemotaxis protein
VRILVADDNRDSANSWAALLELAGHEVRTAYNGLQALSVAAEFKPQLALLDIGMPELSGYDVARRIRETDWGVGATLVALTGWGQERDKQHASAAGFDHHFTKPVELSALDPILATLPTREGLP